MGVGHSLDAPAAAVAAQGNAPSVVLVELLSKPAGQAVVPVRLTTGRYTVTWNGADWLASGHLLSFSPIKESKLPMEHGLQIGVSIVDPAIRSLALDAQYAYVGRPITVWVAFLDGNYQVAGTPDIAFRGFVSRMPMVDRVGRNGEPGRSEVTIHCASRYARLRRSQEVRMSDEQQRALYPNAGGPGIPDTGLRHMAQLVEDNSTPFGTR